MNMNYPHRQEKKSFKVSANAVNAILYVPKFVIWASIFSISSFTLPTASFENEALFFDGRTGSD